MLVENWRKVLRYGWSVRLIAIAGILSGVEAILPLVPVFIVIPPGILAALTFVVVMGALVARFVVQNSVSGPKDE